MDVKKQLKYELAKNDKLGRYMIAKEDLKEGSVIFTDIPFVIGPRCHSSLLCLNCLTLIINKFNCCHGCKLLPVCYDKCRSDLRQWHDKEECEFFSLLKNCLTPLKLTQNLEIIIILRSLIKMKTNFKDWNNFISLESHMDKRKGTDVWRYHEKTVEFIKSLNILQEDEMKDNLIQKICAILDVNSFEVRSPVGSSFGHAEPLRGIYLNASFMTHSCVANAHLSIDKNYTMTVRACVPIKKGQTVLFNYTNALQGTEKRKEHLMRGKYFECDCQRCLDPSEFSLHISSVICAACKTGYVSKTDMNNWYCNKCQKKYKSSLINTAIEQLMEKYGETDKADVGSLETFIKTASKSLASNHYLIIEAKQCLAGLLRDIMNREINPQKKLMLRKMELCRELLPILEIVEPGISRFKAIALYEMHAAIIQYSNKMVDAKEIDSAEFLNDLIEAQACLRRSIYMLLMEPPDTPEGMLCKRALQDLRYLNTTIQSVGINSCTKDTNLLTIK